MYMSYSHAEPGVYTNQFPMEQGWGCAQLPVTGGNVIGAEHYQPSGGYMFNAESENLEAAWKAYRAVFADVDMLAEYYEQGYGVSTVPAAIEKANPAQCFIDNPDLLICDTDKVYPMTPHESNVDADIASGLKDLTDRYNAALDAGIAEGIGSEIKIDHFDPMNP